ncbi:MAG: S8 family peptidase [Planctomycetota bacterium]|jgi:subtilisin family serine protease
MIGEQQAVSALQHLTRYLFAIIFLFITLSVSKAQAEVKKLCNEEKILAAFESGQQKVKVIIGLEMPQHLKSIKTFRDKQFKAQVRAEIAGRQSNVLSGLSANEFVLSHRYKNFECFAGEVTLQGLGKLLNHPLVKSVELSMIEHKMLAQGIGLINAMTARSSYNGQNVAVAISDTGVDYAHPRLGNGGFPNSKVIGGYDTGDDDSNPIPNGEAHGTACAGIAAGDLGTVGDYIGGVAHNAKIYAMKISFGSSGSAYDTDVIQAWDWCIAHQDDDLYNPILIVSHSFGGGRYFSATEAENARPSYASSAGRLVAAGITVFASSGNEGYCESMAAPAAFSDVISIGSVYDASLGTIGFCVEQESCVSQSEPQCSPPWACWDSSSADKVSCYSNSATFLDLLAPAHDAYTTDISGSSGYEAGDYTPDFGGTSAACPYAAGAAACLQSAAKILTGSYLTPQELRDALVNTGDNITDSKSSIVTPRVNLQNAINSIQVIATPPDAFDVMVLTEPNTPVVITLEASDDGLPDPPNQLSYIITKLPNQGSFADPCAADINSVPYTLAEFGNEVVFTPKSGCLLPVNFNFKANDSGSEPNGGDSNEATVTVGFEAVLYSANMDTDPGWTLDGSEWQWGQPAGDGGSPFSYPDPVSGFTGPNVVGYNLSGEYANKMNSTEWATTPAIDCGDTAVVKLAFYRWLNVDSANNDQAPIEISNDGNNWSQLWINSSAVTDSSWQWQEFDISAYAANQTTVYIRWGMGPTNKNRPYSGWNIDDVSVIGQYQGQVIAGDFEPDCDVDFFDFGILANAWLSGFDDGNWCLPCDISEPNDNIINTLDLQVFTSNWLEGK